MMRAIGRRKAREARMMKRSMQRHRDPSGIQVDEEVDMSINQLVKNPMEMMDLGTVVVNGG